MMRSKLALALAAGAVFCVSASGQREGSVQPDEDAGYVSVAMLGISTRAPTAKQTKSLGLKMEVRVRGQIVTRLTLGGAAAEAGIKVGDVLIRLDQNEIFSQDDIVDFLAVAKPGQDVAVLVQRAGGAGEESIKLSLGSKRVRAPFVAKLEWQYASLGQMSDAFAEAKKEGKAILLGLSGAET